MSWLRSGMWNILTILWKDNRIAGCEISQEDKPPYEGRSFRKKMMEATLTAYEGKEKGIR